MRGLWHELADLVLPGGCAGCGAPRARLRLCDSCGESLARCTARRVRPSPAPAGLPAVYAALTYADEARAVLLAHKERGALPLAPPLGAALAAAVRAAVAADPSSPRCRAPDQTSTRSAAALPGSRTPVLLVPVPSARRAVAARGHDPVRRIALAAAGLLRREGVPARVVRVLRQRRIVADQAGLSAAERAVNLRGALEVAPGGERLLGSAGGRPAQVVVVDDLMTTGASLAEAARAVTVRTGTEPAAAVVAVRHRERARRAFQHF